MDLITASKAQWATPARDVYSINAYAWQAKTGSVRVHSTTAVGPLVQNQATGDVPLGKDSAAALKQAVESSGLLSLPAQTATADTKLPIGKPVDAPGTVMVRVDDRFWSSDASPQARAAVEQIYAALEKVAPLS